METLDRASTQYGDMKGTVALDWHGGTEIFDLARDKAGIDTERWFPLCLRIWIAVDHSKPGELEYSLGITIYAADKTVVGDSFDEIAKDAAAKGKLKLRAFDCKVSLAEFERYVKRFDILLKPGDKGGLNPLAGVEYEYGNEDSD